MSVPYESVPHQLFEFSIVHAWIAINSWQVCHCMSFESAFALRMALALSCCVVSALTIPGQLLVLHQQGLHSSVLINEDTLIMPYADLEVDTTGAQVQAANLK